MKIILTITLLIFLNGCSLLKPVSQKQLERDENRNDEKIPTVKVDTKAPGIKISEMKPEKNKEDIKYTLNDIKIERKKNGVLISLDYTGDEPKKNITGFFSGDNFFNISFYKGSFSKKIKRYIYNKAVVGSVKFFDFEDSVQITLRLRDDHKSSFIDTSERKILISVFN